MRSHVCRGLRSGSVVLAASLAVLAMVASGCGTTDWERDLLTGLLGLGPIPIPLPGPAGPAGAAGTAGAAGVDGAPGPNIIIARAVVNPDGTLENSDDVTVVHTVVGAYELTVDVTGDTLPAGTTEDDFEVFVTVKEDSPQLLYVPYYVPISLVGTNLRIDVLIRTNMTTPTDRGFSVQVLLPAG